MIASETIIARREAQVVFEGVLLGTAVGDALGLPAENLSPGRIRRLWHGEWKMRFLFGHGMISDDTEHTLLVAQSLLVPSQESRVPSSIRSPGNFAGGSRRCLAASAWQPPRPV